MSSWSGPGCSPSWTTGTPPIHSLVDEKALRAGLLSDAGDYGKPWFGQLMAGPQMLAYLIQINEWMSRYHLTV